MKNQGRLELPLLQEFMQSGPANEDPPLPPLPTDPTDVFIDPMMSSSILPSTSTAAYQAEASIYEASGAETPITDASITKIISSSVTSSEASVIKSPASDASVNEVPASEIIAIETPASGANESHDAESHKSKRTDTEEESMICRVCRSEEGSLYYPCLCTGSIKYVHQECLLEWLKHSKREVCELCNHKYSFQPIYRSDMPKKLPVTEILKGIGREIGRFMRTWLVYTMVIFAWLGVVPLTAARVFTLVFSANFNNILTLPISFFTVENILQDVARGCILLAIFVSTFISLLWLREQIVHGGPHEWLHLDGEEEDREEEAEDEEEEVDREAEDGEPPNGDGEPPNGDGEPPNGIMAIQLAGEEEGEEARERRAEEESVEGQEGRLLREFLEEFERGVNGEGGAENGEDVGAINPGERERNIRERRRQRHRQRGEEAAGEQGAAAGVGVEGARQEDQWRDWDRLGDELTWQRLLGLDGSLVFIEHVFWVISLNTLFTIFFAYLPYKLGMILLALAGLTPISFFPYVSAMLTGYLAVSILIYIAHTAASSMRMRVLHRWLGICYLVLKVFILVTLEIGFFPVLCGCWLDLCSLKLFSSSYSSRLSAFSTAPSASVFLHWMIGMVYVFYSASFVILLREILRPGVLWFLRNLNDPEFNPIQEMIDQPVQRHIRRLGASTVLFFFAIMLVVYAPLEMISLLPGILPYNMSLTAETPLSELSVELLILQVVLPALLEQTHARSILKIAVRKWCKVVGRLLQLDNYLLAAEEDAVAAGDEQRPADAQPAEQQEEAAVGVEDAAGVRALPGIAGGLAAEHQALLLLRDARAPLQYSRPSFFALRIFALICLLSLTTVCTSLFFFVVPVCLGRFLVVSLSGHTNVHELYTTATGAYAIWLTVKGLSMIFEWLPQGGRRLATAAMDVLKLLSRVIAVSLPMLLVIPLLFGLCFQLFVLAPIRVSEYQMPLLFLWQDWAMGILHTKIVGAAIMMGPDWRMKEVFEQIYNDGLLALRVGFVYRELIIPVLALFAGILSLPYLLGRLIVSMTETETGTALMVIRLTYPTLLIIGCLMGLLYWHVCKLRALAEAIRNEKYLVGTQLVNYEREERRAKEAAEAQLVAAADVVAAIQLQQPPTEIDPPDQ